ncbi:trans-sulfuration enzyme family protein [Fimbriimonas ginsengisoli]|uniref:Cystathionine gamma-lyase n=1 Tax=Fimbriimonas ginsengisoli Gsoil 348 TaxID=661478 RepID=A0A068NUI0_FIMGI|nr:PLP-dependent aspartate aminotransferase family protein [Fimbriimonas ginsengisoli]AIE85274.1 cystathionine gamma-lyase [Fimbriimonas ginsengisoli Gsoil 348]
MRFATRALRVGQDPDPKFRAVIPPLYQSATFAWEDLDHIPEIDYTRCSNPNRKILEQVIASLENGKHCVLYASGMASIGAAFALLKQGDHLLMANDIYGGTFRLAEQWLPRQGISTSYFCAHDPGSLADAVTPETKMVIFETPTNPNLRVSDIAALTKEAKKLGLIVVFDNTFASPALQNPLDLGVDIVVHSTTKYISGHSDVIGGAAVTNDDKLFEGLFEWNKAFGAVPSPFDCWLSLRGVKTLGCRMAAHCRNAQAVAEFLAGHPKVARVHYPGLIEHPDHQVAKRQMVGGFGGMLALELHSVEAARKVAEGTKVFLLAESLGGVESLIAYPPLMSHATMTEAQRLDRNIPPTMLRLSVGVEDAQDLIEDLEAALARV